jgi:membrane fusion protein (multidrug efflux system)
VADGDRVELDQVLAVVVAKNSAAALEGAEQMLAVAHTVADEADARRAIELARSQLVQQTLRAPTAGIVLSHSAETGDYVDESEVLLTLAPEGAVFFDAQVAQSDVNRVRAGQVARIDLPAISAEPVSAVVHGNLPVASSENFSAPVRLDFSPARTHVEVGLFGEASIVVGTRADATVVPADAVLRDDVNGVSRIALVESGVAHWVTVDTGVQQGGNVEILHPPIELGARVVTDGQVGLPDGVKVVVQP